MLTKKLFLVISIPFFIYSSLLCLEESTKLGSFDELAQRIRSERNKLKEKKDGILEKKSILINDWEKKDRSRIEIEEQIIRNLTEQKEILSQKLATSENDILVKKKEKEQLTKERSNLLSQIEEIASQIDRYNQLIAAYELKEQMILKQLCIIEYTEHEWWILFRMPTPEKISFLNINRDMRAAAKRYHNQKKHWEFAQTCSTKLSRDPDFLIKKNSADHDCRELIKAVLYANGIKV